MEIIAEIGQNHNGDIKLALELIHYAKESGADSVKFQLFCARTLFPQDNNPWYDYNCKTELSKEQLYLIAEECKKADIEFLASPFDVERVDWLEEIGVKRYKIASRSIEDEKLIKTICKTGKPIIASLGMWEQTDFPDILSDRVDFLYCISKYPTPLNELHLESVDFTKYSGISDHTLGISATVAALARGARIVEKHFTLDKEMYGPDHSCSITPDELKEIHRFRMEFQQLL